MADIQTTAKKTKDVAEDSFTGGFNQLADGLGGLLSDFKNLKSSEAVTSLLATIAPFTDSIKSGAKFMAGYSRRHPVRIAVSVIALGALVAYALKPSASAQEPETLH